MSRSASNMGTLHIKAADAATEIFVVDSSFKRIKSGIGNLDVEVPAGFYKVRFRSGASQHDHLVEVEHGEICNVEGPIIEFYSAAPIERTRTTHEFHSEPANFHSQRKPNVASLGGSIFIFLREDREDCPFQPRGVTLHSLNGVEIAAIENGDSNLNEKWAALRVELNPGTYSLRVTSQGLGSYEMFLSVCDGWQTQIFLTYELFWTDGIEVSAPSLRRSSVYMSKDHRGFDSSNPGVRLSELARQGLTQGRDVISKSLMNEYLQGKFNFPFLGIVALHILMRRPDRKQNLIDEVIRNLGYLLHQHPDLDILRLANEGDQPDKVVNINNPPLLAASWDMLTKATKRRASLVGSRSTVSNIAHNVVFGGPWLIHRVPEITTSPSLETSSIAGSERKFKTLLEADQSFVAEMVSQRDNQSLNFSQLERSIVELIVTNEKFGHLSRTREKEPVADAIRKLRNLPAPSYSIAEAVDSLSLKLKANIPTV